MFLVSCLSRNAFASNLKNIVTPSFFLNDMAATGTSDGRATQKQYHVKKQKLVGCRVLLVLCKAAHKHALTEATRSQSLAKPPEKSTWTPPACQGVKRTAKYQWLLHLEFSKLFGTQMYNTISPAAMFLPGFTLTGRHGNATPYSPWHIPQSVGVGWARVYLHGTEHDSS